MAQIKLTLACRDYDHTRALRDRNVAVGGAELQVVSITPPSQIFLRMLRSEEFDVSEISLSNYLITLDRGDTRFVGLNRLDTTSRFALPQENVSLCPVLVSAGESRSFG